MINPTPHATQSMTGFANIRQAFAEGEFAPPCTPVCPPLWVELECQSINSKYLELFWRADDSLRRFEMPIRQAVKAAFARGRITVSVSIRLQSPLELATALGAHDSRSPSQAAAHTAMAQLAQWQTALQRQFPEARPLSVFECLQLMQWNTPLAAVDKSNAGLGLTSIEAMLNHDDEALAMWQAATQTQLMRVVDRALQALRISREEEAARILPMLRDKAEQIMAHVHAIESLAQHASAPLFTRLQSQLAPLITDTAIDPARLAQEVAMLAIRHDIGEELDRLRSHGVHLQDLLSGNHLALGKPLEFLLQELGREVNTIASKTIQTEVSERTMNMKHLIDQIREQAQNLQ